MRNLVAPVRERGLKSFVDAVPKNIVGRSRKGAWIEICFRYRLRLFDCVAPVRERGLKYCSHRPLICAVSRSRKGAWIEIAPPLAFKA